MLEQQVFEILQRQIVAVEASAPGLGQRGLRQDDVGQQHGQRQHEERVGEHDPAPFAEFDDAPLTALAGQRDEAATADQPALQAEQHDGDQQKRNRIGRGDLRSDRLAEELQ